MHLGQPPQSFEELVKQLSFCSLGVKHQHFCFLLYSKYHILSRYSRKMVYLLRSEHSTPPPQGLAPPLEDEAAIGVLHGGFQRNHERNGQGSGRLRLIDSADAHDSRAMAQELAQSR